MSTEALRVAVAKPDAGVIGGFERVVQRVVRWLRAQGHEVRVVSVRTDLPVESTIGALPSKQLQRASPAFIAHLSQLTAFRRLDLSDADVVISTQPPSQGIRHDRHLALFYHHDRAFYDLAELMIRSGMVADAELHRELSSLVREADKPGMDGVRQFVVPSMTVQDRLRRFNGVPRVLPFHAGLGQALGPLSPDADRDRSHVLCVSRHEFPKRTELFVASAHLVPEVPSVCVGAGALLGRVQQLDRYLDRGASIPPEELWLRPTSASMPRMGPAGAGRVRFVSHVLGNELERLYREARCVVAPAFDEDYGLTAIEAMAWGAPLVVCEDGGSLAELVSQTGAGEVVEPDHRAISDAVRRIAYDPELARHYGAAGREAVEHRFTWSAAFEQLDDALEAVAG